MQLSSRRILYDKGAQLAVHSKQSVARREMRMSATRSHAMTWLFACLLVAICNVAGGLRSSESEPLTMHKVLNEKNLKGKGAIVYSKGRGTGKGRTRNGFECSPHDTTRVGGPSTLRLMSIVRIALPSEDARFLPHASRARCFALIVLNDQYCKATPPSSSSYHIITFFLVFGAS